MLAERQTRRQMLTTGAAALSGVAALSRCLSAIAVARRREDPAFPPTRVITRGPRHHWFGYYDKLQFDPTGRYVLGMSVPFEHRSPEPDDVITVGMVDLQD